MSDYISFIVTIEDSVFCETNRICVKTNKFCSNELTYWREGNTRKEIRDLLPLHCKDFGEILDVEVISESVIVNKDEK